jgi:tetratricopeptide (TPR) repeat protein
LLTNQARARAGVLLSSTSSKRWTVLKPVEAKSELGATLSILPDDSILASGAKPLNDRYRVVLTVPKNIALAAVRLEALTHPSLPGNGPGRNTGRFRGSFGQVSWNVTAVLPDRKDPIKLEFDQAWADHQTSAYPINKYGHWNIAGYQGKNATAIWSMAKPVSLTKGTKLTFEMQCHTFDGNSESLGHFRLSLSSDPAAIEREPIYLALTPADPWQTLAAVYQLQGNQQAIERLVEQHPKLVGRIGDLFTQGKDWQRAVEIYSKGITAQTPDADLLAKRARAHEELKNWDAATADWSRAATGNPDEANLLAEFAQRLAVAGQVPLANGLFDKAQALYERALDADPENDSVATELAQFLLDKAAIPTWTLLKPTEMKSEGGATLTLVADGSVLASGPNPDHDSYTLVCPTSLANIVAVRLEALPDPSLPSNGPGRAQGNGNVALSEWKVTVEPQKPGGTPRVIRWKDAWSDHRLEAVEHYANHPMHIGLVIDGDSKTYWETWPRSGSSHSAIFLPDEPIGLEQGSKLKFSLDFRAEPIGHNLGRFRLSISSKPTALEQEQNRFSVLKVADPWLKLATAYARNGRTDKALSYFDRALQQADGYEARRPIVELAAQSDDVLSALIQRQPDDAQLQLAMARKLAERGKHRLVEKQPAQAQAELEKSREMFTRLCAKPWSVLTPTELKSQGGETLTVEKDGSIFVTGPNPNRAVYTLKLRTDLPTLTAIRLETIPDARLPLGGAGRYGNGNWHLSEFTAAIVPGQANTKPIPIEFGSAIGDSSQDTQTSAAKTIDGDTGTRWDTYPRMNETHWAVFVLKSPARVDGGSLRITLDSGTTIWGMHSLGHFRISATSDADISRAIVRNDIKDSEVGDLSIALAKAHAQQGRLNEAVSLFTEALNRTTEHGAKARLITEAAALEGLLEKLAEHAAGDAQFQARLALHYAERGNTPLADAARAKVRALFEQKLAKEPENSALARELFSIYQSAGHTREAIPYLAKASAANPTDILLSLQVAALQAWFGQDKELVATRKQILAITRDASDVFVAERAAKACSICATTDKADLEAALALARKAVELGNGGEWNLTALGMAEYRSGNYQAADKALRDAVEAGPNSAFVTGCSAFYRAMILFRQGKPDEARKLAIAAAAKMQPLPRDENNPLTGSAYHDDLILWLAYKEAKALIKFDAAASPKVEKDKK